MSDEVDGKLRAAFYGRWGGRGSIKSTTTAVQRSLLAQLRDLHGAFWHKYLIGSVVRCADLSCCLLGLYIPSPSKDISGWVPTCDCTFMVVSWLLEFYILATTKTVWGWAPTYDSVHLLQIYSAVTGRTGHQHHDLISHSVTLSWHSANQSLPYPNNTECLARRRQV